MQRGVYFFISSLLRLPPLYTQTVLRYPLANAGHAKTRGFGWRRIGYLRKLVLKMCWCGCAQIATCESRATSSKSPCCGVRSPIPYGLSCQLLHNAELVGTDLAKLLGMQRLLRGLIGWICLLMLVPMAHADAVSQQFTQHCQSIGMVANLTTFTCVASTTTGGKTDGPPTPTTPPVSPPATTTDAQQIEQRRLYNLFLTCQRQGVLNGASNPECAFASAPTVAATQAMSDLLGGDPNFNLPLVGTHGVPMDLSTMHPTDLISSVSGAK